MLGTIILSLSLTLSIFVYNFTKLVHSPRKQILELNSVISAWTLTTFMIANILLILIGIIVSLYFIIFDVWYLFWLFILFWVWTSIIKTFMFFYFIDDFCLNFVQGLDFLLCSLSLYFDIFSDMNFLNYCFGYWLYL